MPRIVSFLPAGTEIVHALGAGDQLVGRSHECDYPAGVERLPVVSRPALALDGLSQSEIDVAVATALGSGDSLYVVDEHLLRELAPDAILTQDLCQVCAPSGNELTRAVASLPSKPVVVYLSPRTLADIDDNILAVGEAIGRASEARAIVARNHERMDAVHERTAKLARRSRVMFLEWTDPPYCAGHWVPEMIGVAGGDDPLGRAGADSVRVTWSDIATARPEIMIVAPCGYGFSDAERMSRELPAVGGARVVPVDANAFFARPGPRYIDGIELLERIFRDASSDASTALPAARIL
jgi:iron complex transport system substrate-binding protein